MHPEYGSMDQEILIHGSWINVFRNLDPNGYPLDQEMDRDLTKSRSIANGSRFHKMDQDPLSIFGHFLHFSYFSIGFSTHFGIGCDLDPFKMDRDCASR